MPHTILCSAGTSIAFGTDALKGYQNRPSAWDDDTTQLRAAIRERLKGFDLGAEAGRVKASAELNALHRLPVRADDEIVLFATDTADGRCCAEAVKEVLTEHYGVGSVIVERVEGLQVRDRDALRTAGLVNLTRRLVHYLDDPQRRYGGGCVLNTNGGFKGIVPFFALLGMIFRAPVVYVFEFAECLIHLPPLPVGFATDLFERALPALRWAECEREFDPEEFFRRVPGLQDSEREWFGSFLEVIDLGGETSQLAGLSPLTQVLTQREVEGSLEVWLSPDAQKRYVEIVGNLRSEANDHLRKLSSPLWRSQHIARKHETNLDFYPQDRCPDPWRFAGFSEGSRFYVAWFTNQKSEYLDNIPRHQREDYETRLFIKVDLPLIEATEPLLPEDPDRNKSWLELYEECRKLRQMLDDGASGNETVDKLKRKIAGLESALKGRNRKISKLQSEKRTSTELSKREAAFERLAEKVGGAKVGSAKPRPKV